jgi:transposase
MPGGLTLEAGAIGLPIGQDAEDIREFGVYSQDHQELCKWLSENGIESIAMESTGTYWQNLFSALTAAGI